MGNGEEEIELFAMIHLVEERLKTENPSEYKKYIKLDNYAKIVYIENNMDILDLGYDKEILLEINKILHPLLEEVFTEETAKEIYFNNAGRYYLAMDNVIAFRTILLKYAHNISSRTPDEESRLSLPYYLMIVESVFTQHLNNLVFLLIKNEIKYYRTTQGKRKIKNINNISEVREETLFNKLHFLNDNEFSLISNTCDRDLRNSIAHMNFILNPDGSVQYNNNVNGISKKELDSRIEKMLNVCHCLNESFRLFFGKKLELIN